MAVGVRGVGMTKALIVFSFALSVSGLGADRLCNTNGAQQAEMEAETLRSWDNLYTSYRLRHQCDDSAIGEGYSESVARILVDHWETLPRLAHLTRNDMAFRRFVLKHVDETLNDTDLKKISANAATRCPNGLRVLCRDLKKKAEAP